MLNLSFHLFKKCTQELTLPSNLMFLPKNVKPASADVYILLMIASTFARCVFYRIGVKKLNLKAVKNGTKTS